MKTTQRIAAVALVVLLAAGVYAWIRTGQGEEYAALRKAKHAIRADSTLVDQSALRSAQQIAQMPTAAEEKPFAEQGLRLSDFGVDLAFSQALRDAKEHPPALSVEAKEAQARLQKSQRLLEADKARADELDAAIDKAAGAKKDALDEELDLVKAQAELDQDEVDDAKQDLIGAGGDPQGRIQAMVQEHENLAHNGPGIGAPAAAEKLGLVYRGQQWWMLHQKQMALWKAKSEADARSAALAAKHEALDAQLETAKANSPALQHHAKSEKAAALAAAPTLASGGLSQEDTEELLDKTQRIASSQKTLASYDKQAETQKDLSDNYAQWIQVVAGKQRAVVHRSLIGVLAILTIVLVCLYFSTVLDKVMGRVKMDRRQQQNLRTVARLTLQVVALLLILLIIVGMPGQLGTFLGLATAGLTVALKDFIVGFIGWLVLMGKNGIRMGDWVEINGVTGEVVELGMFHTVLLETGNWTDSGHPTGRRVTFTNSFAIEGHYFNFSTSGQWLWDELQVVLPAGQDPYPMMDAIQKQVQEATSKSAKEAESEWRGATGSKEMGGFSVAPAISVKPVVGGIEVAVRYITKANERYQLRSSLYQAIVKMLGGKEAAIISPPQPPAAPAS
jgi:small-conductance mechanosensitive channel